MTGELPQPLQEEFERTAHLLHDGDSIRQALMEAIEEALANNQAFEELRDELEQKYQGQWIIIADSKFLGAADTPEAMNHLAPTASHRIVAQIGQVRPQKVELGWQMMFA